MFPQIHSANMTGFSGQLLSPEQLQDDLMIRLRADLGVTLVGGAVDSWQSQDNVGYTFTAPAASNRGTFTAANADFSNRPTVKFPSGTGLKYSNYPAYSSKEYTFMYCLDVQNMTRCVIDFQRTRTTISFDSTSTRKPRFFISDTWYEIGNSITAGVHIITVRFDPYLGIINVRVDGNNQGTIYEKYDQGYDIGSAIANTVGLGSFYTTGNELVTDLAEINIYDRLLTLREIEGLEAFMANHYKL